MFGSASKKDVDAIAAGINHQTWFVRVRYRGEDVTPKLLELFEGSRQIPAGELPLACAATSAAAVRVQQMAIEAAVRGDVTLLKQAMLHDPLVGAVCNPEEVWQMTDEMLVAQAEWLPQYAAQIPKARQRLAGHARNCTRVKLRDTPGAARLPTKSVDEMSRHATESRERLGGGQGEAHNDQLIRRA